MLFWRRGHVYVMCVATYNPGQKGLGHLPIFSWFCMEFTANLRYTLINTASTRFFPQTKLTSIKCTRYVKRVWLVTPNTVQGGGGSTWSTFSSPKTQSVPNVLTRIEACEQALRLGISLKVDVREARERKTRTRGEGGGGGPSRLCPSFARSRGARPNRRACPQARSLLEWHMLLPEPGLWFLPGAGFPLGREKSSHSWRAAKILRVWQLPRPHELEYFKT